MTSYSQRLDKYLTNTEKQNIAKDYTTNTIVNTSSFDDKNRIIGEFYNAELQPLLWTIFQVNPIHINVLGSGTQGVVLGFESQQLKEGLNKLSTKCKRIRGPYYETQLPNKIAMKFQLLDTNSSYSEKKMIREENILHYLNEETSNSKNAPKTIINNAIPKLYYGCTYTFKNVKFRLTFMELIDTNGYMTLEHCLTRFQHIPVAEEAYNNLESIVKSLWKLKVSHNDLSIRNIMIGVTKENLGKVKLLDFGLSEIFEDDFAYDKDPKERYKNIFSKREKREQSGSNVEKLRELCSNVFKSSKC